MGDITKEQLEEIYNGYPSNGGLTVLREEGASRFCTNCGTVLIHDIRICEFCGSQGSYRTPEILTWKQITEANKKNRSWQCDIMPWRIIHGYFPDVYNKYIAATQIPMPGGSRSRSEDSLNEQERFDKQYFSTILYMLRDIMGLPKR